MRILLALSILFLISCKSKKEAETTRITNDLKTYFTSLLRDTATTIDSFYLVKIDTLTEQDRLRSQSEVLWGDYDKAFRLYKNNVDNMGQKVRDMKLYAAIGSSSLVNINKDEVKELAEKNEVIKSEIDTISKIATEIDNRIEKADSVKPVGYLAKCFYQVRLKDKSVERDTAYITLNENKDIVDRKVFIQKPYQADFSKLE